MNDGDRLVGWLLSKRQPRERWGRRRGWWARSRALCNQCWKWQQLPGGKNLSKSILSQEQIKSSFDQNVMNSWPPGWRPLPWCWPPPCAAWATFPAGCVAGFCPGSPEILKKVHLECGSVTWRSSFEYLAATTNKQTCCHLWYSSSCPSIVVSLTLTDAVECECQLSFELFSAWHVAQASLLRPCQLWGRISFVQLWRLGKSSTTFRCTLLQSSKDKEDFLCLLTPPQTFTNV